MPDEGGRRDNITDEALGAYRAHYGDWVTKDHIFAYVYGILHSPGYRGQYASDLAKMLPRIPEVATAEAFESFSKAGQQLLELHIGYEAAEPYALEEHLKSGAPDGPTRYRIQKMRWGGPTRTPDRSVIVLQTTGSRWRAYPTKPTNTSSALAQHWNGCWTATG